MKKLHNCQKGYVDIILETGDWIHERLSIQDFCLTIFNCYPAFRSRYFIPSMFEEVFGKNYYVWCDYFDGRLPDKNSDWKSLVAADGNYIEKAYIGDLYGLTAKGFPFKPKLHNILVFDRSKGGYKFLGVFVEDDFFGHDLETFRGIGYSKISDRFIFPVEKKSLIASYCKKYSD